VIVGSYGGWLGGQRVNARLIYGRSSDRVEFSHPYVDPRRQSLLISRD